MQTHPFHAEGFDHYHDNLDCMTGENELALGNVSFGTGDKPLCRECYDLFVWGDG